MATKATLTASIATINDGGANTASEVRTVFTNELNNAYGTVSTETFQNLTNVTPNTTPTISGKFYALKMVKQGRCVSVTGNISNTTGGILSNVKWFDIDAGEYLPDSTSVIVFQAFTNTGTIVKCSVVGGEVNVLGSIGNNITIQFNFQYFTLD